MNAAIHCIEADAILLAPVLIALFQQSEIKEVECTLSGIYSEVQANAKNILASQHDVWEFSDLIEDVYEEEQGGQ